jgi:hypothetical protein
VFPEQDAEQDEVGLAEVIGLEGYRAVRILFPKAPDTLKTNDPHVKSIAPRQLVYYQFERIDILPLMLDEVEHGFHFIKLLFFHGLKIIMIEFHNFSSF